MKRTNQFVGRLVLVAVVLAAPVAAAAASREAVGPVPAGEMPVLAQAAGGDSDTVTGVVNINEATLQQLTLLPGIGPARAQAIIAYREEHPFRRVEELLRIRGIGRSSLDRLRPYVTLDGRTTLTRSVPATSPRRSGR